MDRTFCLDAQIVQIQNISVLGLNYSGLFNDVLFVNFIAVDLKTPYFLESSAFGKVVVWGVTHECMLLGNVPGSHLKVLLWRLAST